MNDRLKPVQWRETPLTRSKQTPLTTKPTPKRFVSRNLGREIPETFTLWDVSPPIYPVLSRELGTRVVSGDKKRRNVEPGGYPETNFPSEVTIFV